MFNERIYREYQELTQQQDLLFTAAFYVIRYPERSLKYFLWPRWINLWDEWSRVRLC